MDLQETNGRISRKESITPKQKKNKRGRSYSKDLLDAPLIHLSPHVQVCVDVYI